MHLTDQAEVCMDELRRLRKARGLSQAKLAALADLDPSTVSQIETGARRANTRTLERLAAALGAEVPDLFPKGQAPLPDFEDERRAEVLPWAAYARQIAERIQGHADDPGSPAFRDTQAAFFFVEEANRTAADLGRIVDEQASIALENADIEAMQDLFDAFAVLGFAIGVASARAYLMKAAAPEDETARKRAEKAAKEREAVERELSAHLEYSA